ncbi:HET-domain-containing protein, partial [Mytilinidion resinicola]
MRLINVNTYEIEEFFGSDIPNYIALSHTWLPQEEPSFQDWSNAIMTELNKVLGYEKIHNFICKSQTLDGTYCWADTVCIDKSSSAELSEAINSMYKIYRNCHHCLVYLADVKAETKHSKDEYSRLVQSRWFTRGWTLQELIAPEDLVFYDKNWRYLGLRNIYLAAIQQTTGISTDVLVGTTNLKSYSIAERMSWASKRTTTREEDLAYCLLGILDINMPLLYGEGEKAFQRLQEEIIKKYDDDSVFVWSCSSASSSTYRGILARSPSEFANSRGISFFGSRYSEPYSMTNQGLRAQ